jgi:hypothetical protein
VAKSVDCAAFIIIIIIIIIFNRTLTKHYREVAEAYRNKNYVKSIGKVCLNGDLATSEMLESKFTLLDQARK